MKDLLPSKTQVQKGGLSINLIRFQATISVNSRIMGLSLHIWPTDKLSRNENKYNHLSK